MIAVVTAFLAALMIQDGFNGDHSTANAAARIVAGGLLVLLAVVVAALCLAPGWIRDVLRRRAG
jgi:hypothetical protein